MPGGSETIRSLRRRHAPVAQEVEHLPFKQGVRGSSPRWSTNKYATPSGVAYLFPAGTRIIIEGPCGAFIDQFSNWSIPLFAPIPREAQMQGSPRCRVYRAIAKGSRIKFMCYFEGDEDKHDTVKQGHEAPFAAA